MLKEERLHHILRFLDKDKKVLLGALSSELGVSGDTIRRDIKELAARRLLREVRGGALPLTPGAHETKEHEHFASRQNTLMAKKAVKLLKKGQVVLLDSGPSSLAVASLLPANLNLTVVTNSFPVAQLMAERPGTELYFAGGRLFRESFITIGQDASGFYQQVKADICFLGVFSIHLEGGLTGQFYDECAVKKSMIASADQVYALATAEKLNSTESFHICPISSLDGLITPSPDIEWLKPYRKAGIRVI
jgi:DeoR/GlpR family transcriptional regulator of sugar metabolism